MKKSTLAASLAVGCLAIGLYVYKTLIPTENLLRTGQEIAELRKNLQTCHILPYSPIETSCSGQYKTPGEIVKARRKVIEEAGCQDESIWKIKAVPYIIETKTVLANCGLFDSNWTMESNNYPYCPSTAKLVPFGNLADLAIHDGYRINPITDGAWWTRSYAGSDYECVRE
ncbi:MAG: hypothetical protein Q7K45_05360 [Nanoarchaeota archaeon]|nr:hypothetical protein [Nanoarchaeota archaeon]